MSDIEYITKDNAIQAIFSFPYVMRNSEILHRVANSIRFTPSEDVAPVIHGHWIIHYGGSVEFRECSICHKSIRNSIFSYCPFCGAKMDKKGR